MLQNIKFERLMCEVEFWEVFLKKGTRVFISGAPRGHLLAADSLTSSLPFTFLLRRVNSAYLASLLLSSLPDCK